MNEQKHSSCWLNKWTWPVGTCSSRRAAHQAMQLAAALFSRKRPAQHRSTTNWRSQRHTDIQNSRFEPLTDAAHSSYVSYACAFLHYLPSRLHRRHRASRPQQIWVQHRSLCAAHTVALTLNWATKVWLLDACLTAN